MIAGIRTGLHTMQIVELLLSGNAQPLLLYGPLPWATTHTNSGVIMPNLNNPLNNQDDHIDFLLYGFTDEEMDQWATNMALKDIS